MAEKSSSDEKLKGALAYLAGPVTGIVLLMIEKKNAFVRFHAMQSTIVFGSFLVLNIILGLVPVIGWFVALVISPLLAIVCFVLWLVLMWKAYNGMKYKVPYFGEIAEKQLAKMK